MTFEREVDSFIEQKRDEILQLISKVVATNSVEAAASADNAPYGEQVRKALDIMLDAANSYGLDTIDGGGYFGFAYLDGERDDYLATLSHLDIVPAGEGWDTDPFTMVERDGYILGRGVSDDKGPSVLSLFALLFFKDRPRKLGMRAIFGCNEETGMTDMDRYNALYEPPFFAFTPDGNFPVGYGEKTVIDGQFISTNSTDVIVELKGSDASNVIPKKAIAVVRSSIDLKSTDSVDVIKDGDLIKITAHGTGGHTAHPEGSTNAADILFDYIIENSICKGDELKTVKALKQLTSDYTGGTAGIAVTKPYFTPLSMVPSMFEVKDGKIVATLNIRAPFGCAAEDIADKLSNFGNDNNMEYCAGYVSYGIFMDPTSKPIRILCEVYDSCTGSKSKPETMSGGTYARKLDNCVSFGPSIEDEETPDFVGLVHGADEGVSIDRLMFSLKVYILSLQRLLDECGDALA